MSPSASKVARTGSSRPRSAFRSRSDTCGFTLIELLLATFISGLVIAIVSVALSFCLRLWERNQYQDPPNGVQLLDLLSLQIGSFYPFPVQLEKSKRTLLSGTQDTLLLATGYSVRALSKGAPVIARYQFNEHEHKIYYSEMPLDPYHPERIKEFIDTPPSEKGAGPFQFYEVKATQWAFSYWDPDGQDLVDQWDNPTVLPTEIRVTGTWAKDAPEWVRIITVGFLFPEGNPQGNQAQ
jgi:hypothetical protein